MLNLENITSKQLERIVKEVDAKIILSSTWFLNRKVYNALMRFLKKRGLQCIGATPRKLSSSRSNEIMWSIDTLKPDDRYVILDDLDLDFTMYDNGDYIQSRFVKTDSDTGINRRISKPCY